MEAGRTQVQGGQWGLLALAWGLHSRCDGGMHGVETLQRQLQSQQHGLSSREDLLPWEGGCCEALSALRTPLGRGSLQGNRGVTEGSPRGTAEGTGCVWGARA